MNIDIAGGIIAATVTNIIIELKRVWPNYRFLNWRHLFQIGKLIDFPLPLYPYFSKARHAQDSSMNSLSVWINTKSAEFLLNTNIKKIILNGKTADYPLLVMLPKHDTLLDPIRQYKIYKYIAKKSKAALLKCDSEHNIFLSTRINPVFEAIKEYTEKLR